jgi:protein TonB
MATALARVSDPVRGGVSVLLSAVVHLSLFLLILQIAEPIRHAAVPVEVEIVTKQIRQEAAKTAVTPAIPRAARERPAVRPMPEVRQEPAAPVGETVETAPAESSSLVAPVVTEPAIPIGPSIPDLPVTNEPVYTPLVQVTQMPGFKMRVEPAYPEQARRLEKEGLVVMEVSLSETGEVLKLQVVQKAGYGFDEAAEEAIRRSSFEPARIGDRPVAVVVRIPIRFRFRE